jgi:hypothetical protein
MRGAVSIRVQSFAAPHKLIDCFVGEVREARTKAVNESQFHCLDHAEFWRDYVGCHFVPPDVPIAQIIMNASKAQTFIIPA